MSIFKFSIPIILVFLSGCATGLKMPASAIQEIQLPEAGKAQIVFMRSTFVGSAISASLYDVTSGNPDFVGIIQNDDKIVYSVSPGENMFMVVGETADFMGANVTAGKTYYAMVTPRMGLWKARFSLLPIRQSGTAEFTMDSKNFDKWKKNTKIVEVDDAARAWYAKNLSSIRTKQSENWKDWMAKSFNDKYERTLQIEDGN